MNKRKIFFRADAGQSIGYGHFIRTLALADMLKNDFDCIFYTQSPTEYQINEVTKVCVLKTLPANESKFDIFLDLLNGDEIVVLDNYFNTPEYQKEIKSKGCKLVCIDDLHDCHYYADLIINQGIGYTDSDYSKEPYSKLVSGLEYSLLRKPFFDAAANKQIRYIQRDNLSVVVAFGGSDYLNLSGIVIEAIIQKANIKKVVAIIGDSYNNSHLIIDDKVEYKRNLSAEQIADLFTNTDVAILPASTLMNEALACGTNVIGGYYVENQKYDYNAFYSEGFINGVGDFTDSTAYLKISTLLDSFEPSKKVCISSETPQRLVNLFKTLVN